jgi:hypothetical protein
MSQFTPEQEKEFEFRLRYEQEQAAAQQQQNKQEDDQTAVDRARTIGIPAGAIAGGGSHLLGKTADVGRFLTGQKYEAPGFYGRGAPPMEKYGRSMNLQHTGEQKWFGGKEMDEIYDRMRQAHKDPALAAQYEKEALKQMKPVRRAGEKIATAVPESMRGVLTNPMGFLGKTVMGAGAGMQAADAAARYGNDDTSGALISGIGAMGTAASMIPHPIARVGGTAVGMGAEGLNMFLDKLKNKKQMAKGGLVDEEDGLSKAEKTALRIMKKKKKKEVKKFVTGGLTAPLITAVNQNEPISYATSSDGMVGPTMDTASPNQPAPVTAPVNNVPATPLVTAPVKPPVMPPTFASPFAVTPKPKRPMPRIDFRTAMKRIPRPR